MRCGEALDGCSQRVVTEQRAPSPTPEVRMTRSVSPLVISSIAARPSERAKLSCEAIT